MRPKNSVSLSISIYIYIVAIQFEPPRIGQPLYKGQSMYIVFVRRFHCTFTYLVTI